jgi:ferrous iron transport protein B
MKFALIGQPNCGKSTLFNQVAGYKAETGNFSGTTVTFTESKVRVLGQVVELVDLPGTYTLAGTNPAERVVFEYLAQNPVDVVINVVDATHLAHALELTLELLELQRPMVIAINMMDEAKRLGQKINGPELQNILGVPVLPLVASRGRGVRELFVTAFHQAANQHWPARQPFSPEIEQMIAAVVAQLDGRGISLARETTAIKLLEGDQEVDRRVMAANPDLAQTIRLAQDSLARMRQQEAVWVLGGERHVRASQIARGVVEEGLHRMTWRDRIDDVLLHPVWGYFALIFILYLFFQFVYSFGSLLEAPLLGIFDQLGAVLEQWLGAGTFWNYLVGGLVQGISGGVGIVLPYLLPFLLGLGLLEDIGYLPRVAFLMDALMHRIGLHGKAIVPFILGYGCNVPAIMSTRIMEDRHDRFLAAALATLVPCAARLSVVFGLVAFYLGPLIALLIYLFNIVVIAFTAKILSRMMPEDTPGLILEMPVYRMPTFNAVFNKAWFRVYEFVVEAWPLLILGSVVLSLLAYFQWDQVVNMLTLPLVWLLGLPKEVGVPLIFGILRKELSLVMLHQALGGVDLVTVLTGVQMITFSVFVVFYIPCLATLMVLRKELGTRVMLAIAGMTFVIAVVTALIARFTALLFFH